jgi:hypothetical protein
MSKSKLEKLEEELNFAERNYKEKLAALVAAAKAILSAEAPPPKGSTSGKGTSNPAPPIEN